MHLDHPHVFHKNMENGLYSKIFVVEPLVLDFLDFVLAVRVV
jgi:hypothetical protein